MRTWEMYRIQKATAVLSANDVPAYVLGFDNILIINSFNSIQFNFVQYSRFWTLFYSIEFHGKIVSSLADLLRDSAYALYWRQAE